MMIAGIIIVLILLALLFTLSLIRKHDREDHMIYFSKEKRSPVRLVSLTDDEFRFEFDVPYANPGTGEGIFLDAFARVYLPDEQYNGALLRGRVNHSTRPREDDYFEAMLIPPGSKDYLTMKFDLVPRNGKKTAKEAVLTMPDVEVALYVARRGRGPLFYDKENILITGEELKALVK